MATLNEKFISLNRTIDFMDLYVIRSSILRAIKQIAIPSLYGTLLDVGCGVMPYRELLTSPPSRVTKYIGMDIQSETYQANVDLRWDGNSIPLPNSSVDTAMATEVLEHCYEPKVVLDEIFRVLRPNGVLFFTVPFLWPLHDSPYDYYRYTPFALQRLFKEAGFASSDIKPLTGWNGALAQAIGLWVKRSPLSPEQRARFETDFFPVYESLVDADECQPSFGNNQMSAGWTGIATKG